jgi:hypothetical protein
MYPSHSFHLPYSISLYGYPPWSELFLTPVATDLTGGDGRCRKDKHTERWDQVCWVLGWRHIEASWLLFSNNFSLTSLFFSIFKALLLKSIFKILLLFYSLKSFSLDLHSSMFSL